MRLHFIPNTESLQPFGGHVYLRGFFFSTNCHVDYSKQPIIQPFYLHIPYRSDCQIKRERSLLNNTNNQIKENNGITYSTVVIVQHHHLFVTNRDKAYSVTCFYRDLSRELERRLDMNDISSSQISSQADAPVCQYEVLRLNSNESSKESVRFANIGEQLTHKWSCESEEMGMLVHSCTVRDGNGHSFQLIDQRGCVTDYSLMPSLIYSSQLNSSFTLINAFKFADQMSIFFRCQITLCDKKQNGCEGITPPSCQFIPLPSNGGPPLPIIESSHDITSQNIQQNILIKHKNQENNKILPLIKCCKLNENGLWIPLINIKTERNKRENKQKIDLNNKTSNLIENKQKNLITIDVVADGLVIFARDEGPNLEERNKLLVQLKQSALTINKEEKQQNQCPFLFATIPFWIWIIFALIPLLLISLFIEYYLLNKKIKMLKSFRTPSFPVEMCGFPSSFGQCPLAKPRRYTGGGGF
uniref:ZP domain-containing protein n=1 Tax=Meloidogyne hapla TaxID=6305 RepID=A0A1I8B8W6_MELHA